ncbi:MAG: pentapeptide repeat-containing protein [Crocosphaera sp.]|nr:pentapeptide repeat-containing protein [Crocosphaera sp.]
MTNISQDPSNNSSSTMSKDFDISVLIESLKNEKNIDNRSRIIRRLGECDEPEVLIHLFKLKSHLDEEDEFIQYEIQLSLNKLINNEKLLDNTELNVDFILDNLVLDDNFEIVNRSQKSSEVPHILIDSNLFEEFLLRTQTTLFRDANKVVKYILSGKIKPYIGVKGVRHIWSSLKEHKGQQFANKFVLELLNIFTICGVNVKDIELDKYPNLNIPTVIQIEIARKYNLDGILTLRYNDFIGSGYPYVYSHPMFAQAIEDTNSGLVPLTETLKKFDAANITEKKRQEFTNILEEKTQPNSWIEGELKLFQGWKIDKFEILSSSNYLTSATVILVDETGDKRAKSSAFKSGSINALLTAFDEALEQIIDQKKHQLQEIYVANLTSHKEGRVTVQAVVKTHNRKVITIYTHENIIKAYFFAYIKAIIAIYAPDEYKSDVHSEEELRSLYRIGRRDFYQLNFSKINLSDSEVNLANFNLKECNLSYANLSGTNLTNTNLEGADLSYADLTDVQLDTANLTLFTDTVLTNTKFPQICIPADGKSRMDKVSHLLRQTNTDISNYQISAIHRMTTSTWWMSDLGEKFWQVNQQLLAKGIQIKRLFILPQNPNSEHLKILEKQAHAGVNVRYVRHENAKHINDYDFSNINLLVCENLSVQQNSFTTRMIFHEQKESGGYISFKQQEIKTDKERFSLIWECKESEALLGGVFPIDSTKQK